MPFTDVAYYHGIIKADYILAGVSLVNTLVVLAGVYSYRSHISIASRFDGM